MKAFNIPVGQYYPANTLAHRLDPRVKIILVFVFVVSLLALKTISSIFLVFALVAAVMGLLRLPARWIIKSIKPLRYIILFAFLMHAFFTSSGRILFSFGPFNLFDQGIINGIMTCSRLILLVLGTSLLTITTTPIELTDGLESLLRPLRTFGLPVHEIVMMMTLALRFIPLLLTETERIMKAQMARGADYESSNFFRRAKNMTSLLIPLFISIFRRADELALAMESRGYRGGETRTRMRHLELRAVDIATFSFLVLILLALSIWGRI